MWKCRSFTKLKISIDFVSFSWFIELNVLEKRFTHFDRIQFTRAFYRLQRFRRWKKKFTREKFVLTSNAIIIDVEWIKLNAKQRIVVNVIYFVVNVIYDEFIEKSTNINYFFLFDNSNNTKKNRSKHRYEQIAF